MIGGHPYIPMTDAEYMFSYIVASVIALAFLLSIGHRIYVKIRLSKAPEITAYVKVSRKGVPIRSLHYAMAAAEAASKRERNSTCLLFKLPNNDTKWFKWIECEIYNSITEGETGVLTYKQHGKHLKFVSFKPEWHDKVK